MFEWTENTDRVIQSEDNVSITRFGLSEQDEIYLLKYVTGIHFIKQVVFA